MAAMVRRWVRLEDVPSWNDMELFPSPFPLLSHGHRSSFYDPLSASAHRALPSGTFSVHTRINSKVYLWRDQPWLLDVDAVVNSSNENLDVQESTALHAAAGPGLAQECASLGGCRTGVAEITNAYNLPARRVIHTVGPKYVEKYHSAAENALSRCYLSCLELLIENNLCSIAFGCIYTQAKGYPREKAAHVALCTVRRFLEKHEGKISALIFCPTTAVDIEIYERLMWMYFPRTKLEEENALILLPVDVQDENGEIVTVERQIRIKELPGAPELAEGFRSPASKDVANRRLSLEECIIDPLFLSMVEDPDSRREEQWKQHAKMHGSWTWQLKGTQGHFSDKISEDGLLYHRYLARAKAVDLSEAADMKILYRSGLDVEGRPVMVVVGAHFLLRRLDMEQFVLYVLKEFEQLIHGQYTIVYFHSAAALQFFPDLQWMNHIQKILGERHKKNLHVRSPLLLRLYTRF